MKRISIFSIVIVAVLATFTVARAQSNSNQTSGHTVGSLKITVLSTMLADGGSLGEWGFAALIEVDGNRLLFDTGARPTTVLKNARELGVDLSTIREVFLSHHHYDHTGGLLTLRREVSGEDPEALQRTHVGKGIFYDRPPPSRPWAQSPEGLKTEYESMGGVFVVHDNPYELFPGVWITGPVPRVYPERNYPENGKITTSSGAIEDTIPESQSLVINTDRGLVVISGCGHAGIINTLDYARKQINNVPVYAAIGGFHLIAASDDHLRWTADRMREFGVSHFMGAHCTGINPVFTLRTFLEMDRTTGVVGAVGAEFELGKGIQPGVIAR